MPEEIFPLVDENGTVVGQAPRSKCHDGSKLLHPVVHLYVFNTDGNIFLQKRSATKDIQPNRWDSSASGHMDLGETPQEAVTREAQEEIGIDSLSLCYIGKYIIETNVERELTYCFYTVYSGIFSIDNNEVVDGRFWTITEIQSHLGDGTFTMNFEHSFKTFLSEGLDNIPSL